MKKSLRYQELDCLRGLAAISVVLFHFTYGYDNGVGILSEERFYFRYGNFGVHLFFLISGFVIFMTLEKTKKAKDFIISRFSRLYPAYWATIFLTVILTTLLSTPFQKGIFTTNQILVNLTMLQHWFKVKDVDGAFWTLAVELTFYFIMLTIYLMKKQKSIIYICGIWLLTAVIFSSFEIPYEVYFNTILILKFAPLFIGGIFFYLIKHNSNNNYFHLLIFASLFSELLILYQSNSDQVTYWIISFFYAIFYLFIYNKLGFLINKGLVFFGTISYSLYLIHENIGYGLIYWFKKIVDYQLFYVSLTFLIVTFLAVFITYFIEKPAMKFIRNLYSNTQTLEIIEKEEFEN